MNSDSGLLAPPLHQRRPRLPTARRVTSLRLTWTRAALAALLLLTAAAYVWDLSASGNANSFYAAAVQAGTKSWKAFFFGSLDPSNFITVDKPPASLWVMELSGRVFGFSSWSMLVPQALEGVAAVGLLYASIKRWFGTGAGLVAGAVLATTPVAALMFRFNNPDALLVLLLVASAYCLTRALEKASTKWMLAVGAMIGVAFLAKMMQAFLVVPGFALVYVIAAPTTLRRRLLQLLGGAGALVLSAGWWVAMVALWPAASRPMIDGSSDNSILNLIVGYNGLGRIFGSGGPGGGGGGGGNFSGSAGLLRLFNDLMGGQASWLLPAAALALAAGLWSTGRAPRTDRTRAALLLWGGWLVVTALVFSLSSGIIHTYYTVALAPAIAALVAIGGAMLWRRRATLQARALAIVALVITAGWSWILLDRTPSWNPWLRTAVAVTAVAASCGLVAISFRRSWTRRIGAPAVALAIVACLIGPVAYAAQTITTAHTGSVPSAGPSSGSGMGGGFGGPGGFGAGGRTGGGFSGSRPPGAPAVTPGASSSGGSAVSQLFAKGGTASARPGGGLSDASPGGGLSDASPGGGLSDASPGGGGPGGGQTTVSAALKQALEADAGRYRWVAATAGSQSAASLELATGGAPVMGIGGFSGQGGNLSLAQFKQYVADKEIRYYIANGSGGGGPAGRAGSSSAITTWVTTHFKKVTIGGQTLYDLTQPSTGRS